MKRNEIDNKFKWDLTTIYPTAEDYNKDFETLKKLIPEFGKFKGNFLENAERFLEFITLYEKAGRLLGKLDMYPHLAIDVEPDNAIMQELKSNIDGLCDEFSEAVLFVDLEVNAKADEVEKLLEDERVQKYKNWFNAILRYKPHILSDKEEEIINAAQSAFAAYKTYSTIKPVFEPVIIDGKEHFLNEETAREFYKNPDQSIRKQAYEKITKEYKKFANTYAATLEASTKEDVFNAKVRKFDSPLDAAVFGDEVSSDLFKKILKAANETYHEYFVEYMDLYRKVLKLDKLMKYDIFVPLVKEPSSKYTLDEAFELIFEATKNFGSEYRAILEKARDEKWIDYLPHEGKRHGAYSSGNFDTNPYVLLSFTNDIESIFTLIHELGHSCHTYLSCQNQDYFNHDYRIFVAEVASTTNENLLLNLLISKAKTKEEKMYLLYKKIDDFVGTCYRQPFFAKFEDILHNKAANNEGLSAKAITDIYAEIENEYYGGKVELPEMARYGCFGVPHFYYNYYVYKYTIGNCVASVIANRVFNGDEEQIKNYLNFLKSGSSKSPVELLKAAGVDPLADDLYKEAFEGFKKDLDEFKALIEE